MPRDDDEVQPLDRLIVGVRRAGGGRRLRESPELGSVWQVGEVVSVQAVLALLAGAALVHLLGGAEQAPSSGSGHRSHRSSGNSGSNPDGSNPGRRNPGNPDSNPGHRGSGSPRANSGLNPSVPLYHVTRDVNAALIQRRGFDPGYARTEGGRAAVKAEMELAGEWDEEREWLWDYGERSEEERAREAFDAILDDALFKESRRRGAELPAHYESVFFWSDLSTARYRKELIERNTRMPYRIIEVDASKIPCRCYEADIAKTDALFDEIMENLEWAEGCANIAEPYLEDEKEEREYEKFCRHLERIAESYYKGMKPFSGKPKPGKEVLCPCSIPPDAIRSVREH